MNETGISNNEPTEFYEDGPLEGYEKREVTNYYLTLKASYKVQPTPNLRNHLTTLQNTIIAHYGPDVFLEIDREEAQKLFKQAMLQDADSMPQN